MRGAEEEEVKRERMQDLVTRVQRVVVVRNGFTVVDLDCARGEQWLSCYVQNTKQGLGKVIDCCMESKNRRTQGIYTGRATLGICGFVGATILGYMTANNMTNNTREHD